MTGLKYDQGKNRLGLVFRGFSKALWQVGLVGTFGANKYKPDSWQEVEQERYKDALLRHLFLRFQGEKIDDESIEIVKKQIFSDGKTAKVVIGEVNA